MPQTGSIPHPPPLLPLFLARSAWYPPLLLVLLPILLFLPGLGTGAPPFGGDVLVLNYPLLVLIKHYVAGGALPLWNNYAGGGYPLAPFSGLIAYPPLWPLRVLTVNDAITVLDIMHFALAGLGVYALTSITGASRPGRTIGALSFVLSGFMIGHLYAGHLFELGVVAWMPWVFYAAHRLVVRLTVRAALLLGLVAGLQVLANGIGFLVFTAYPVAALLAIGVIIHVRNAGWHALKLPALALLSGLIALGLAAVIVLPFAQSLGWSVRAGGLDFRGASEISLPPAALLMAFSPDAVGNAPHDTYWLDQYIAGYWHEYALYTGLLPLLAALMACLHCRHRPWVRFYAALLVLGLLLALGRYTPLYGLAFHSLPGLDLVRVPARWLLLSTLGLSVLTGLGVDWLLDQRDGAWALLHALRRPLLAALVLIVALVAGLQVIYMRTGHLAWQPHLLATAVPAGRRLLIFGGFLALLLACHAERLIREHATQALALAFTLLDLWCAATGSIRFINPSSYYTPTAVGSLLAHDPSLYRVLTIGPFRALPIRQGMVQQDLYNAEDFAPITLRPYWSISHPWATANGEVSNADERDLISCYDARFANLLGIGVVTTSQPFTSQRLCVDKNVVAPSHLTLLAAVASERWLLPNGHSWNPTYFFSVIYVYRNPSALPRASLLPLNAVRLMPAASVQLRAVLRKDFDGTHTLVLDTHQAQVPLGLGQLQDAWARLLRPASLPLPSLSLGEARVITDTGNTLQVAVRARAPSYLLLDDAYYPGWQVWLNGHPAPISRADYALRAVRVPAGTSSLVFVYAPLSYLLGLAISGTTAVLVLIGLVVYRRAQHPTALPEVSSTTPSTFSSAPLAPTGSAVS